MGIAIVLIAYCVIYFGMGRVGGDTSDGVGICIVFLPVFLSRFYPLGGRAQCMLVSSPSEVGMVTPSEGCVSGWYGGDFGSVGIIAWCVCSCDTLVCAWR